MGEVLKFPSLSKDVTVYSSEPFEVITHAADRHMVAAFLLYAQTLSFAVEKGPLDPKDRAVFLRMRAVVMGQPVQ